MEGVEGGAELRGSEGVGTTEGAGVGVVGVCAGKFFGCTGVLFADDVTGGGAGGSSASSFPF